MLSLTLLTEPIPSRLSNFKYQIIKLMHLFSDTKIVKYGGHPSVTGSLIRGLSKLKINYNYNPKSVKELARTTIVLCGVSTLRQAIELKKLGKIRKIIAGPNIIVRSTDADRIIGNKYIDMCIVPSEWVKTAYIEELPILKNKIHVWAAGVDTDYWKPSKSKKMNKKVLIYLKNDEVNFLERIIEIIKNYGYRFEIIRYGKYSHQEYKKILNLVDLSIFVTKSESQGIALLESWSMNVPTLVWNVTNATINGRKYTNVSSCPYLSKDTGKIWKDVNDLRIQISSFGALSKKFKPRDWVIQNMSDQISSQKMIELVSKNKGV